MITVCIEVEETDTRYITIWIDGMSIVAESLYEKMSRNQFISNCGHYALNYNRLPDI